MQGHGNSVDSVACSPDGTLLITGSSDRTLRLWDSATGPSEGLWSLVGHDYVRRIVRDGHLAISGGDDDTLKLWDLEKGHLLRVLEGHSGTVFAVASHLTDKRCCRAATMGP